MLTTAYGSRGDGADRSKLWINLSGRFQPFDWRLPDGFGARCLTTRDIDDDSYVDLLGCPAEEGLVLLRNRRASELEIISIGDTSEWYWDAQILKSSMHAPAKIISSVGAAEDMFIEIIDLTPSLEASQRRRISCWKEQWTIPGIYTADVCYCTMLTGMDTPISCVEAQGVPPRACSAMPQICTGRHLKSLQPSLDSLWRKCGFAGL